MIQLNLLTAWGGMLLGALSGCVTGLWFHRPEWLGGYGSWRRRLLRLGHIACFGLAGVNLAFALSIAAAPASALLVAASLCLAVANFLMPAACFLAAWREPFRRLLPIPVACVLAGVSITLVVLIQGALS